MAREEERTARAAEAPIVGNLPNVPGILTAFHLTRGLAEHLRGLADELLVKDFPGATLTRAERELLATAVSAGNDCFYCMDSHGAFACALGASKAQIDTIKIGGTEGLSGKMSALVKVAQLVQGRAREVTRADMEHAVAAGATDADTQLAVLIAAGFCMYNRIVDGFRAQTPATAEAFRGRAQQIAEHGYSDPRVQAIPGR